MTFWGPIYITCQIPPAEFLASDTDCIWYSPCVYMWNNLFLMNSRYFDFFFKQHFSNKSVKNIFCCF